MLLSFRRLLLTDENEWRPLAPVLAVLVWFLLVAACLLFGI